MKKFIILSLFLLLILTGKTVVARDKTIDLYFFYGQGCPHCAKEEVFLSKLEKQKENIKIHRYEVWHNQENAQKLSKISKKLGVSIPGVPMLFISDKSVAGYYNDQVTGKKIMNIISQYEKEDCNDVVGPIIGEKNISKKCEHNCEQNGDACLHNCGCSADNSVMEKKIPEKINIPIIGEVNLKTVSLPTLTFFIGATDGFNPCAMWVLLFLISMLLGMKNKKRMWLLGSTFIIASGVVYFLFLSAWLNTFLFFGYVPWIRVLIAIVALGSGGWHLWEAWKNREGGCHVTDSEKRKKMFYKIKEIITKNNLFIALLGISLLAFAVNLVELACSAGLPAVYTQVLAMSKLPAWQYYLYLFFYVIIFMLDDILVFVVAMTTLQVKDVSSGYTKYSGIIGGIVMVLIGLLLLFKPGWLMFG